MKKTRLGLSVGVLAAIMYFVMLFGGYLPALLILGYVLLLEDNNWLRKSCAKAVVISLAFSVVVSIINLLPDFLGWINSIAAVFKGHVSFAVVDRILNVFLILLALIRTVLFLILGIKALHGKAMSIPVLDNFLADHLDYDEEKAAAKAARKAARAAAQPAPQAPAAPAPQSQAPAAGFCSNCGHALHQGDEVCPGCGRKLNRK